ncbi:MAG: uncharacterized protein QG608_2087 [Actinomycetota bacterium]|nr:uncharacterized protein [Actinomycetota bacterium]
MNDRSWQWNHSDMDSVPDLGSCTGPHVPDPANPRALEPRKQELTDQECWEFLSEVEIGRLAVCVAGDVDIHPLNFVLDDGSIVFPSYEVTGLVEVGLAGRVAFQVDGYDTDLGQAWSVVVKGEAVPLGRDEQAFVRIVPERLTGRRFIVASGEGLEPGRI